jgi:hypothetical protein
LVRFLGLAVAVELLTIAAYARHRGCDEKAVRKAIAEERITTIERDGKPRIDPAVADIQWAANTRPRVGQGAAAAGPAAGAIAAAGAAVAAAAQSAVANGEIGDISYTEAARLLRVEEARIARMDRMERERKLTDAEAVGRAIWTAFRTLRDTAMPLGRRVAGRAAAMSDAREIQQLIDSEMRGVLNAFRDRILSPLAAEHAAPATATPPADDAAA